MAIDYQKKVNEIKEKENSPLDSIERGYVDLIENYIDEQIEKKFSTDNLHVDIEVDYVDFTKPNVGRHYRTMTKGRRDFLKSELISRYEKSGWKVTYHPPVFGRDYEEDGFYRFKGKDS